ncbi:hypothetical protein Bca4012_037938 [Brassica carinata]|uniref:Uncharacterized protein n=1 Tax=Brassica carinata TaxID=52824 RepID=A0A8X8B4R2_BRACI|nr:hypothetical protein Bca52824_006707 [Brassica carinata]
MAAMNLISDLSLRFVEVQDKDYLYFILIVTKVVIIVYMLATQGSLMCHGGSSQLSEPTDLTPAKRIIPPIINLEEAFDQNSITRMACIIKVKKEKIEKRV